MGPIERVARKSDDADAKPTKNGSSQRFAGHFGQPTHVGAVIHWNVVDDQHQSSASEQSRSADLHSAVHLQSSVLANQLHAVFGQRDQRRLVTKNETEQQFYHALVTAQRLQFELFRLPYGSVSRQVGHGSVVACFLVLGNGFPKRVRPFCDCDASSAEFTHVSFVAVASVQHYCVAVAKQRQFADL